MNTEGIVGILKTGGLDLLKGIVALVIGFFLVHWIGKLLKRNKKIQAIEPTLRGFLLNLVKIVLSVIVVLTAANIMGIPMTSILTLMASGSVAIGLALQGAVGNLIGGLILLILRPIKAGEYVKIGDNEGVVKTVGAYYTELITPDNKQLSLPNGTLTNAPINNFSRQGTRRLDLTFSVDYGSDLDTVYRVLNELVAGQEGILPEPASQVVLLKCADSSLDFAVRVWVKTEDYWNVNFSLLDKGKRALDAAGISIPFPQMDVHVKS
ncbi:MAG: mechanosensitive ion channel domain-containing protein [Clostridia bacterium]|jgi:small conductance mechanosensitive channel|nr:mechanosensitive ion channel [Clostridia bacterium]